MTPKMNRIVSLLFFGCMGIAVQAQVYTFATDAQERGYYNRPYERYEAEPNLCEASGVFLAPSDDQRDLQSEASHQQALQLRNTTDSVSWIINKAGDGLTLRFSLPDNEQGTGRTSDIDIYAGGTKLKTLRLDSRWAWQYCNANYPQNAPLTGNVIIRMRFDEVHTRLSRKIQTGERLTIRKSANDNITCTIDFAELEPVPAAVTFESVSGSNKVAFNGSGDIADFIAAHEGQTIYIPEGRWETAKRIYLRSQNNTRLIGAGMWYSEIYYSAPSDNINTYDKRGIEASSDNLVVEGLYFNTACRQRYYNQEDSKQVGKAFMGGWGTGSVIRNCWAEHFECGAWIADYSGKSSKNLLVEHCRFRNNYADGFNCSQASEGHTIRYCSFRNNGDDDMASWSTGRRTKNIEFSYCTAENNWRASSLGFFGGTAPSAHHLAIFDALESGIRVNADFAGTGFTAGSAVTIHDVTVSHCGCVSGAKGSKGDFWANAQGAVNIGNTNYYDVPNVHLNDIDVLDSRGNAFYIRSKSGKNLNGLTLNDIRIDGAGGYGIYYSGATGDVYYCHLEIYNCAKGEQTAHMPTFVIHECGENTGIPFESSADGEETVYYDLLGRPATTLQPNSLYKRVIKKQH